MSEFHINVGGAYPTWAALDDFTKGYLEAAFFADNPEGPEWEHVSVADITAEAFEGILGDCAAFKGACAVPLREAAEQHDYQGDQAGRDFWYTRNGHGVGFWDRGLGEIGEDLSRRVGHGTAFPPVDFEDWFG